MPPHYWQDIRVLGVSAAAVATVTALLATPRVRDSFTDSLTSLATSLGFFKQHYDADLSFEEFLESQAEISWNHLRANINPRGTAPGCIVASPSRRKPDYWYQMSSFTVLAYTRDLLLVCVSYWTRDSALVMRTVLQRWKLSEPGSEDEKQLRQILFDFVNATIDMQHRDTPSGGFRTGGLGEGWDRPYPHCYAN